MRTPLLDWLYPSTCALCRTSLRNGSNLCQPCSQSLPKVRPHACLTCGQDFDGSLEAPSSCPNCINERPAFNFATAALRKSESALTLIHQFKLLRRPELGTDLASLCAERFRNEHRFRELVSPLLIPIPLHGSRLRSRGFNQALELSRPLAKELTIPHLEALKRVRPTERQATLTRKQRLKNLNRAFQVRSSAKELEEKDLILIDDVFTTGSTVHECARALLPSKPRSISVLTVLRA